MFRKISSYLPQIIALLFLAAFAAYAWTEPSQTPPGGNTPSPLNVGTSDQTKTGGVLGVFDLLVDNDFEVVGEALFGDLLNLQGNRITNVGSPSSLDDASTKGYVDSATSGLQQRVIGSCPAGQGVQSVDADGSVTCGMALKSTDIVAAGVVMKNAVSGTPCYYMGGDWPPTCNSWFIYYYSGSPIIGYEYDPRGVLSLITAQVPVAGCYLSDCATPLILTVYDSVSCSGGFIADMGNTVAQVYLDRCFFAGPGWACYAGVTCRLP